MNPSRFTSFVFSAVTTGITALGLPASSAAESGDKQICGFSAQARFVEGAPRDRFHFSNNSNSHWNLTSLTLDLSNSNGNLIFDVTAQGAGVEVFQPFRSEGKSAGLTGPPLINDGDQSITLSFTSFTKDTDFTFSIDVDDQLDNSALGQIRVAGSEMEGSALSIDIANDNGDTATISGQFDIQSQFLFATQDCPNP